MRKWKMDVRYKDGCQLGLFGAASATEGSIDMDEFVTKRTLLGGRLIVCNLNIKMDGTFVLRPEKAKRRESSSSSSSASADDLSHPSTSETSEMQELSREQTEESSSTLPLSHNVEEPPQSLESLMMMSSRAQDAADDAQTQTITPQVGRWRVRPNPYCVTDRQYDDLCLILYPKDTRYKKIELRCRVWGRYGLSSVREVLGVDARQCFRMTHGRIAGVRNKSKSGENQTISWWQKSFRNDIVATFRAKPEIIR